MDKQTRLDAILAALAVAFPDREADAFQGQARAIDAFAEEINKGGVSRQDPVRSILSRIGDRWSALLLMLLRLGPLRHGALRRLSNLVRHPDEPELTQRIMTLRLRDLERDGVVSRTVIPDTVTRVEYALTPFGADVMERVAALNYFLLEERKTVLEARMRFEEEDEGSNSRRR